MDEHERVPQKPMQIALYASKAAVKDLSRPVWLVADTDPVRHLVVQSTCLLRRPDKQFDSGRSL